MANDVAYRARAAQPIRIGCKVSLLDGFGYQSTDPVETKADFTTAEIDLHRDEGRHRLYYTTGAADPADGTP